MNGTWIQQRQRLDQYRNAQPPKLACTAPAGEVETSGCSSPELCSDCSDSALTFRSESLEAAVERDRNSCSRILCGPSESHTWFCDFFFELILHRHGSLLKYVPHFITNRLHAVTKSKGRLSKQQFACLLAEPQHPVVNPSSHGNVSI